MEGPIREKKVLCLGAYRTGSSSLAQAMVDLGYDQVFHTVIFSANTPQNVILQKITNLMRAFSDMSDATMSVLPTYNASDYTREQFDQVFGPAEVISDVAPFAGPLLRAYPDAKVILVRRDFDAWATSFLDTIVGPTDWWTARLSGWFFEPICGFCTTSTVYKMAAGFVGVSTRENLRDRKVLRRAYDNYYEMVRKTVPKERLLELDLKEVSWEPVCKFLGKEVPDKKFPRLNESAIMLKNMKEMHRLAFVMGGLKLCVPVILGVGGFFLASWLGSKGYSVPRPSLGALGGASDETILKSTVSSGSVLIGLWWALTRAKF